jgi:hypothetical protein
MVRSPGGSGVLLELYYGPEVRRFYNNGRQGPDFILSDMPVERNFFD